MKKEQGFSLLELLIVVAIIPILLAIAIPNLLRARIAANESSSVSTIRSVIRAQVTYQSAYPTFGYANSLGILGPGGVAATCGVPTQTNACLLDSAVSNATTQASDKSGYYYNMAATQGAGGTTYLSYTVGASAASFNQTGLRDFCSIEDGVVHFQLPTGQSTPTTTSATCTGWSALQ